MAFINVMVHKNLANTRLHGAFTPEVKKIGPWNDPIAVILGKKMHK